MLHFLSQYKDLRIIESFITECQRHWRTSITASESPLELILISCNMDTAYVKVEPSMCDPIALYMIHVDLPWLKSSLRCFHTQ